MSDKKIYYCLKLPNTYFSQLEQKKMRKQEHGKDMQIIYLRMMLYSLGRNGCIYYQNVYDTIEEELAEEFDEDVELIKETVKYLLDNNMISVEDSNISIPEVDRIFLTRSCAFYGLWWRCGELQPDMDQLNRKGSV